MAENYEALVARIRYHIQKADFMGLKEHEGTLLLNEAADAIEGLLAYCNNQEDTIKELVAELEKGDRKHGKWKKHKVNPAAVTFKCSICGSTSVLGIENFCYNCGADMRGKK